MVFLRRIATHLILLTFVAALFAVSFAIGCFSETEGGGKTSSVSKVADNTSGVFLNDDAAKAITQSLETVASATTRASLFLAVPSDCSAPDFTELEKWLSTNGGSVLVKIDTRALIGRTPSDVAASEFEFPQMQIFSDAILFANGTTFCGKSQSLIWTTWNQMVENLERAGQLIGIDDTQALHEPLAGDALESNTKDDSGPMTGTVAVSVFVLESNGALDPDTEDWTEAMYDEVIAKIIAGLSWWTNHALTYGQEVSFTVYPIPFGDPNLLTQYEPIIHDSYDDDLWINEVMARYGYTSDHDLTNVDAYNTALKATYGTDNAFSVFVVNSLNDEDGKFPNGRFAYAYFGGPYTVMTYDNSSYGIDFMGTVTSHEVGHIFHACDEYYQPGYSVCDCTCVGNPWQTENTNCENPELECGQSEDCMMLDNSLVTCPYTFAQLGWNSILPDVNVEPLVIEKAVTQKTSETHSIEVCNTAPEGGTMIHFTAKATNLPYLATENPVGENPTPVDVGPLTVGNVYKCTAANQVAGIKMYLDFATQKTVVGAVYESGQMNGTFEKIGEKSVLLYGEGAGWYTIDELEINLVSGKYYLITFSWDADSPISAYSGATGSAASAFGSHQGPLWGEAFNPTSIEGVEANNSTAVSQVVITGGAPWLSVDPTFGALKAGECTSIIATFAGIAMTAQPHLGAITVVNNDPVEPIVKVAVTMNLQCPACEIDGICYDDQEENPTNDCRLCDLEWASNTWAEDPRDECDFGFDDTSDDDHVRVPEAGGPGGCCG